MTENTKMSPEAEAKLRALCEKNAMTGYEMYCAFSEIFDGDVQKIAQAIAAHGIANLSAFLEGCKKDESDIDDLGILKAAMQVFEKVSEQFAQQAIMAKFGFDPDKTKVVFV